MSGAQFTPGPWSVVSDPMHFDSVTDVADEDGIVASMCGVSPARTVFEMEANARLIAAAPEMLAELKRLAHAYVSLMETGRDRIVQLGGDCDPVDVMEAGNPWLRAAKAVIAKAEGKP